MRVFRPKHPSWLRLRSEQLVATFIGPHSALLCGAIGPKCEGNVDWDYRPASRARDYRKRAHDCIVTAVRATDANACASLLDVAFGWTRMAQQLEKMDPERSDADLEGVRVLVIAPKAKH